VGWAVATVRAMARTAKVATRYLWLTDYADAARKVVDEPTAALDAETEHNLFRRYASAASAVAATTGGITLVVSHRFSTVRMADLIVVVDGGRIVEAGSHVELEKAGGLYAELYELQARSYR